MKQFYRLSIFTSVLFTISVTLVLAHTDNVPGLLFNWTLSGPNPFDYNTDSKVNTFDFLIDTHPGQPHPTGTVTPSPTPDPNNPWPQLQLIQLLGGFVNPVHLTHAGDNSPRLFILEQEGRIRIIKNNQFVSAPFLDISNQVSCCGERGLLGLAFPPAYASKHYFYVNYTDNNGNTVVARYHLTSNPDQADATSGQIILTVAQPFANHNGGSLAFGPDGYLYFGLGDGGSGGDPGNRAQNPNELLGKLLRIDVESGNSSYIIPPTNPFATTPGYKPEIWALGFRNPWKFSFDRLTGDLFIADVGENSWEEINFQPSSSTGGENYGWRCREGAHNFNFTGNCSSLNLTDPVAEYPHPTGCSITGGYVYRGTEFPTLQGIYLYSDYCSGRIWGLRNLNQQWQTHEFLDTSHTITSFGQDQAGNLYLTDYNSGTIYKIDIP